MPIVTARSVSYTHLDVYKRQVLDRFDSVLFTLPFIYATTLCFPVAAV